MTSEVLLGIMIPFIGTSLGAGMVFFLKNQISGICCRRHGGGLFLEPSAACAGEQ